MPFVDFRDGIIKGFRSHQIVDLSIFVFQRKPDGVLKIVYLSLYVCEVPLDFDDDDDDDNEISC